MQSCKQEIICLVLSLCCHQSKAAPGMQGPVELSAYIALALFALNRASALPEVRSLGWLWREKLHYRSFFILLLAQAGGHGVL